MKKVVPHFNSRSGFTLIELLIVIVIIGILAGVVLSVINPAKQQRKAKEASLRSTVEKACLALHACGSSTVKGGKCNSYSDIGVTIPDSPTGAAYYLTVKELDGNEFLTLASGDSLSSDNTEDFSGDQTVHDDAALYFVGDLPAGSGSNKTCRFVCGYNFGTATPVALHEAGTLDGSVNQTFGCLVD